jgi:hypothetical protein
VQDTGCMVNYTVHAKYPNKTVCDPSMRSLCRSFHSFEVCMILQSLAAECARAQRVSITFQRITLRVM